MSGSEERNANYLLRILVRIFDCGSAFEKVGPIESFCSAQRVPNSFPRGKKDVNVFGSCKSACKSR